LDLIKSPITTLFHPQKGLDLSHNAMQRVANLDSETDNPRQSSGQQLNKPRTKARKYLAKQHSCTRSDQKGNTRTEKSGPFQFSINKIPITNIDQQHIPKAFTTKIFLLPSNYLLCGQRISPRHFSPFLAKLPEYAAIGVKQMQCPVGEPSLILKPIKIAGDHA